MYKKLCASNLGELFLYIHFSLGVLFSVKHYKLIL